MTMNEQPKNKMLRESQTEKTEKNILVGFGTENLMDNSPFLNPIPIFLCL